MYIQSFCEGSHLINEGTSVFLGTLVTLPLSTKGEEKIYTGQEWVNCTSLVTEIFFRTKRHNHLVTYRIHTDRFNIQSEITQNFKKTGETFY